MSKITTIIHINTKRNDLYFTLIVKWNVSFHVVLCNQILNDTAQYCVKYCVIIHDIVLQHTGWYLLMVILCPGADVPVGDDKRLRRRPSWSRQQGRHRVRKHPGHLRIPQQVL